MSTSAPAHDTDSADRTSDDTGNSHASATQTPPHAEEDPTEESVETPRETSEAATPITVDATHASRDRRGMVKSVLITIANAGFSVHSDRGDIAKATKRTEIIKAVRRKGLAVDEQMLEQALIALAQKVTSANGSAAADSTAAQAARVSNTPYFRESGALFLNAFEGPVQLTNFDATITADVLEDDGSGAPRRYYEITALVLGMAALTFEVPDDDFTSMAWVPRYLGPSAVVYAGSWTRDHARTAIQELSPKPIPQRRVYTHLGACMVNGQRVFLHAGGALGVDGVASDIRVRPPAALDRYELPAPPCGGALVAAVRASLEVLSVGPPHVMVPLLASAYRAPLGAAPFSVYAYGKTESFKTVLVALMQQHFGAGMDENGLPGSWSSTGNSNEALGFAAKDVVLTVDDFVLTGSLQDAARKHGEADRVLRAQANQRGRQRMASDQSLRPVRFPRGLIVATGEELPRGRSLRNRMCTLEVKEHEIDVDQLTACQKAAGQGEYVTAMSGFIVWMLAHYEILQAARRDVLATLRDWAARSHIGRRTATVVAELVWGWLAFLCFAQRAGLAAEEVAALTGFGLHALIDAGQRQRHLQAESDPVVRFIKLVNSALASGHAHLADRRGEAPEHAEAWGWRALASSRDGPSWMPQGDRIGWLDGDHLYLEPEAALAVAQRVARDGGDPLMIGGGTLHRQLHERQLLVEIDPKRGVLTVRRTLEGRRRDVLYVRADTLERADPTRDATAESDAEPSWEPPRSEADDEEATGLDDDRDVVSDLARSLDYPVAELDSGRWVLPGCRSWEKLLATADARGLRKARQYLSWLAERRGAGAKRR
jgi:hypothetical protein